MASNRRKRPRRVGPRRASATAREMFVVSSYEVTTEPLHEIPENNVPPELAGHLDRLYGLIGSAPRDAIMELERWLERYPKCAKLFNFLGAAYQSIGAVDLADQVARRSYEQFPNYLFAKLNYADLCLCRGRIDEVYDLFGGKFELGQLYPNRKRFHLTEVTAFMGVIGFYFAKKGDVVQARMYHETLKSLAPDHPHVKRLDRYLRRSEFKRLLTGWFAREATGGR